jgi:hypothetical protein
MKKLIMSRTILSLMALSIVSFLHPTQAHAQWAVFDGANLAENIANYGEQAQAQLTRIQQYENQLLMYEDMVAQAKAGNFGAVLQDFGPASSLLGVVEKASSDLDEATIIKQNAQTTANLHGGLTAGMDSLKQAFTDAKAAGGRDAMLQANNEMAQAQAQLQQVVAQQAILDGDLQRAAQQQVQTQQAAAQSDLQNSTLQSIPTARGNSEQMCGSVQGNPYCNGVINNYSSSAGWGGYKSSSSSGSN